MDTILSKASRRFLLAQPLQLGLAILGIALGVAVVTSVDIARASAERAFDVSFEAVAGRATHQILGGSNGLDEALYVRLRTRAGIYPAAPIVEGQVTQVGKRGTTLRILGVYARPGIGDARLRAAVEARLPEGLGVGITQSRTIRAESMRLFDRTFAITRVLRLLAAVIAFAGVFSALMALELERTRELGLLRALGMTQAGLFGLLLAETGLTGLIAGLLSVPVGIGIAATLVYVLYERCFGWSMDLHVDPVIVAQGVALAVGAALLAGIYPARRAARSSPAAVLRND